MKQRVENRVKEIMESKGCDFLDAVLTIDDGVEAFGPYYYCEATGFLVDDSAEDFMMEFMPLYNKTVQEKY